MSCDDPGRGQLNIAIDPDAEPAEAYDATRCAAMVRDALGAGDIDVKILDVLFWRKSALVAKRIVDRRVFLVGDAADLMPPIGGLGGQTALQDVADIA